MADPKRLAEARRLLANETPLAFDCGTLCGHKCCTDFTPGVGVYLVPGELPFFEGNEDWATFDFHSTQDYELAPSWKKYGQIPFLRCTGLCASDRDKRPLECRTYPLMPYLHEDGRLEMRFSPWAEGVCPLTEGYKLEELRPEFVEAARKAWELLLQDADMLDHMNWQTEQLKRWDELPHTDLTDEEE